MRILICADQYYPPTLGGSALSSRRLAHGLAARGHEVTVFAPSLDGRDAEERDGATLVRRFRSIPPLYPRFGAKRSGESRVAWRPGRAVARAMRELAPDVVHMQVPATIGAAAAREARALGIPVVATNHGVLDNLLAFVGIRLRRGSGLQRVAERVFWRTTIGLLDRCDLVTAPTMYACDQLLAHGLARQSIPISNGVDLARFAPPAGPADRAAARSVMALPPDGPIVLYVGRASLEKGLDVLVQAIPRLATPVPVTFVVAGPGDFDVGARAAASGVGPRVRMLGEVPDEQLPVLYRAADVFVLPSTVELQGMVLLEAAASGLPLVGARAMAIPEFLLDGVNGFLHRPGDAADLARRLDDLLDGPERRLAMGATARRLAAVHGLDRMVAQYEEVLLAAVARRRPDMPPNHLDRTIAAVDDVAVVRG